MSRICSAPAVPGALSQFLTPQVWKQVQQAWKPSRAPSRWELQPLLWVLLTLSWCTGQSQEERFAAARAVFVAHHQRSRRPGETLAGFLTALARLPMPVLRALSLGVRGRIGERWIDQLRVNGWLPMACDGSRVECPRSEELQQRLGEAGKAGSAPSIYSTTLVLLPLGVPWSWQWGKGTASEHHHLRQLLPTVPLQTMIVADACYLGYELFAAIRRVPAAFLVRLSSRAYLYTTEKVPLTAWTEGLVYYWPKAVQDKNQPPILARLLRIKGAKADDVWLLTSVLEADQLSRKTAGQIYAWRWRNEGLFRDYKRLLGKVKLSSRTVALVHREAEGSMLALQLLLAQAVQTPAGRPVDLPGSPRRELLRLRAAITEALRSLGPRQFAKYQRMLMRVRNRARPTRTSAKVRQQWARRKDHQPPKPPKLREMSEALKAKLNKVLRVA